MKNFQKKNSELRAPSERGRITTSYADEQVQEMLQLLARKTDTRQQAAAAAHRGSGWAGQQTFEVRARVSPSSLFFKTKLEHIISFL